MLRPFSPRGERAFIFRVKESWTMRITVQGEERECPGGTTAGEVLAAQASLAARVNGAVRDLSQVLAEGDAVEPVTFAEPAGREVYWHTSSHILAQAVKRLFPEARLGVGPAIEEGFYYDFDLPRPLEPQDLERISAEMGRIVGEALPLERREVTRGEAEERMAAGGESYKLELVRGLPEGEPISLYHQGEFVDLCAGPHLSDTGRVGAWKLLSVAGAYWRGDQRNAQLQRIYGVSFPTAPELAAHLERLEEARRRDHRRLGRELDLFSIQDEAGAGLVLWHPRGAQVREIIEDFWRREHRRRGYQLVFSPHIGREQLWRTSGHLSWYRENMYAGLEVEGQHYLVKPMNCPYHILMYRSATRSYRELPLRWGELGTVYRYERSGVLHGLLRVRGFTQDDAHIFCREDQLEDEIVGVLDLARYMLASFGFTDYEIVLAVRDPGNKEKYVGSDAGWDAAEKALVRALERAGLPFVRAEGEAKFYAPALDITLKDALGRGWQGPTIQVDFNLPERFDLSYVGPDGREHRPFMIHRTVLGSMERFLGSLIEHYAGAFPLWLAPLQVRVLPVAERHAAYARQVREALGAAGLRAEVDERDEKLGWRIRHAQLEKIPYMLVVGDREAAEGRVAVRHREQGDQGSWSLEELVGRLREEVAASGPRP